MGRKKNQVSKTVALQTDADGKVAWDAVLKQGQAADKLAVFSRPEDQKAKWTEDMERPGEELDKLNSERTMLALAKVMDDKAQKNVPQRRGGVSDEPQFLRYTPNQQAPGHNSGCQQRVRFRFYWKFIQKIKILMSAPRHIVQSNQIAFLI